MEQLELFNTQLEFNYGGHNDGSSTDAQRGLSG